MVHYRAAFWPCLIFGVACIWLGTVFYTASRSLFDAEAFGAKAEHALEDPAVAAAAAEYVTQAVIKSRPDLIALRPVILAGANVIVKTRGFRALAGRAALKAHEAMFSEGARRILLSLPDLNVLLNAALEQASPQLAARLPKELETAAATIGGGRRIALALEGARAARRAGALWAILFPAGAALLALAVWLARNRRRALARAGAGLTLAGVTLALIVPAARLLITLAVEDPLLRGLCRGLFSAYFGELRDWGLFLAGLGILLAAGATSLLEEVDPLVRLRAAGDYLIHPPKSPSGRVSWAIVLFSLGALCVRYPLEISAVSWFLAGVGAAFLAVREFFRLFLQYLAPHVHEGEAGGGAGFEVAAAGVACAVLLLAGIWISWRNPAAASAPAVIRACNGSPALCEKRVDEIVFAGAHNAMSHQEAAGWLFPHHEAGIERQLEDGIRALLLDVHYGFPGGARVKTDLEKEPLTDQVRRAVGAEGLRAAMRIRDRLVGVDEGRRKLYLCHGLCELGAYELRPALSEIREFLVTHPDDVLLLIIEDYVSPADLAAEFDAAGLTPMVYKGSAEQGWPKLRDLAAANQRVIVFIESGRGGVGWLRPAFQNIQETPYGFRSPADFTCAPNRGGPTGALFLMNHWIETTPTPRPSNAAVVNAYDFLKKRALQCREERQRLPNIIAVDFYKTGGLLRVVNDLNAGR